MQPNAGAQTHIDHAYSRSAASKLANDFRLPTLSAGLAVLLRFRVGRLDAPYADCPVPRARGEEVI